MALNLSPAKDFANTMHGKTWQEVVGETQFQEAAKVAMLECVSDFSNAAPNEAGYRLQGAQSFLRKLMSLCETKTTTGREDTLNLTR